MAKPISKFQEALLYATELHKDQIRKAGKVPYIAHLLGVASLVLEDGGDETQAIAALLHDALEDQSDKTSPQEITARFGEEVTKLVQGCTEPRAIPKPPWKERKQAYLKHLEEASEGTLRIALADKLHNLRALKADLERHGESLWQNFNASKEEKLWFYRECTKIIEKRIESPLLEEIKSEMETLSVASKSNASKGNSSTMRPKISREQWEKAIRAGFQALRDPNSPLPKA